MKLIACTFTGADDRTPSSRLAELSTQYPFIEWGIAYSPDDQGNPRYPSDVWIDAFLETCAHAKKSIHLCYDGLIGLTYGKPEIIRRTAGFQRVQLNLGSISDLTAINREGLIRHVRANPQTQFILQYGQRTKEFLALFNGIPNVAVLFDESLGKGVETNFPIPVKGRVCGYAGNFGPESVSGKLYSLLQIVPRNRSIWICMESRVRDPVTDKFDVEENGRVVQVAENVKAAAVTHRYRLTKFSIADMCGPTG